MKNTVNARELFLLCALRNGIVKAKNLSVYDWTLRHFWFVQEMVLELKKGESLKVVQNLATDKARLEVPSQQVKERNFYIREGDFSTLCDYDEDLSWYQPSTSVSPSISDWEYKGNFELSIPLTEKEKHILTYYGGR
ncbi:MAG: hypothetical protein WCT42_02945 [Candidatus Paceibacterota bacterium]|jgi:hypothetical protein